jgi:tripartite-type tricarboxylate transporter receptor subunit TctC
VPLIQELGQNDLDRRALIFIGSGAAFGRPLLAPPRVPPERIAMLRRAFDRTMADPEFLAEAMRLNMDIKPLAGEELQRIATEIVHSSPESLARAKELIGATRER